jgi:hypothetical protein
MNRFAYPILLVFIAPLLALAAVRGEAQDSPSHAADRRGGPVILEDFQSYPARGLPTRWEYIDRRQVFIPVTPDIMREDEHFIIKEENGNRFLRAFTRGRAHRLVLVNHRAYEWNLTEHPRLQWRWRAHHLPVGAREDQPRLNDTGGAMYVTFSRDWLGRPRSIKYSYSSTLPIGSVATYGRLKVLVVSTGADGIGDWITVDRNVIDDYRMLFGGEPPDEPLSIMVWSDSDSVEDRAEVDFDDIILLPPRQR